MPNSILTPKQGEFLKLAAMEEEITRWFYLTGGTALAEFYLHHRLSDDIDFFSFSQINDKFLDRFFERISKPFQIADIKKDHIMGLYTYKMSFTDKQTLKIDFNEFPFEQLEYPNNQYGKLKIDSYFDICVNKLQTVTGRFQTRDFIDLYFILRKEDFSLDDLMKRVEDKYSQAIEKEYLGSQFLRVMDLPRAYPKMLVPFEYGEMREFFIRLAGKLGKKSFKG